MAVVSCDCNVSTSVNGSGSSTLESISKEDAGWVLKNAFLVLTMQSGFGLLEAGCVSPKNVAHIMVKNMVDLCFGGFTYWICGFALSFGKQGCWLVNCAEFMVTDVHESTMGPLYTKFFFHLSFATAATTIVSGAVAERMRLAAYVCFSAANTLIYSVPVGWVWSPLGFLRRLGYYDFAGASVVHLSGGVIALFAAWMLGPRLGRFDTGSDGERAYRLSSPVTALAGTFTLWWGWLGFNCASTLGLTDGRWRMAALVSVNTMQASFGGGITGMLVTAAMGARGRPHSIVHLTVSVLAGLVASTGAASVITPSEAFFCGCVGALVAIAGVHLLVHFEIDDPVGAAPVHLGAAIVGTLWVGLFGDGYFDQLQKGSRGLFHGGGWYLLGLQTAGMLVIAAWSLTASGICLLALKRLVGLRVELEAEILGADLVEHGIPLKNLETVVEAALLRRGTQGEKLKGMMDEMEKYTDDPQKLMDWLKLCVIKNEADNTAFVLAVNKDTQAAGIRGLEPDERPRKRSTIKSPSKTLAVVAELVNEYAPQIGPLSETTVNPRLEPPRI